MHKLTKMPLSDDENGSLKDCLNALSIETEAMVTAREEMITKMKTQLDQALQIFATNMRTRRKAVSFN